MLADKAEPMPMSHAAQRASFFRQSGWLMIANIAGGALTYAVHLLNRFLPEGQYGSFGTFLAVVMVLPTMPLQMVVSQQTAKALATRNEAELSGVVRLVWWVTSILWLAGTAVVLLCQRAILNYWGMTDPVGLWVTLPIILVSVWLPMFWGVLQGQQNFLWLGWTMIIAGLGRFLIAAVAVMALGAGAAGMMAGVLLGIASAVVIAAWQTRSVWLTVPQTFDWRGLFRQIIPLALGFLGLQVLFTADTILVKGYFSKADVDSYVCAGTMSRGLMWLVPPLASVMFPRLVHSAAKSEKTNLMTLVFLGSAVLGVTGAISLSVLGPWIIAHIFPQFKVLAPRILPWYVSAMVPLAMANVLLNNLLARPDSKLVLAFGVLLIAAGYIVSLTQIHGSLVTVLQVLGASNLLLLALCAWFTWGVRPKPQALPAN